MIRQTVFVRRSDAAGLSSCMVFACARPARLDHRYGRGRRGRRGRRRRGDGAYAGRSHQHRHDRRGRNVHRHRSGREPEGRFNRVLDGGAHASEPSTGGAATSDVRRLGRRHRHARRRAVAERSEFDRGHRGASSATWPRARSTTRCAITPGFTLFRRSVVARRQSDDARRDAARRVGIRLEPHAGALRRCAAERSVRQLGVLEPHPAGGRGSRRSGARRDRRSVWRRTRSVASCRC